MGFYFTALINENELEALFLKKKLENLSDSTILSKPLVFQDNRISKQLSEIFDDISQSSPSDIQIELFIIPVINTSNITLSDEDKFRNLLNSFKSNIDEAKGKYSRFANIWFWPFFYLNHRFSEKEFINSISQNVDILTVFSNKNILGGTFTPQDFYENIYQFLLLLSANAKFKTSGGFWNSILPVNDKKKINTFATYLIIPSYFESVLGEALNYFRNEIVSAFLNKSSTSDFICPTLDPSPREKVIGNNCDIQKLMDTHIKACFAIPPNFVEIRFDDFLNYSGTEKEIAICDEEECKSCISVCLEKYKNYLNEVYAETSRKLKEGSENNLRNNYSPVALIEKLKECEHKYKSEIKDINISEDNIKHPPILKDVVKEFIKNNPVVNQIAAQREKIRNFRYNSALPAVWAIPIFLLIYFLIRLIGISINLTNSLMLIIISLLISYGVSYNLYKKCRAKELKELQYLWEKALKDYKNFIENRILEHLLQLFDAVSIKYRNRMISYILSEVSSLIEKNKSIEKFIESLPKILESFFYRKRKQTISPNPSSSQIRGFIENEMSDLKKNLGKLIIDKNCNYQDIVNTLRAKIEYAVDSVCEKLLSKKERLDIVSISKEEIFALKNNLTTIVPQSENEVYFCVYGKIEKPRLENPGVSFNSFFKHPKVLGAVIYGIKKWEKYDEQ